MTTLHNWTGLNNQPRTNFFYLFIFFLSLHKRHSLIGSLHSATPMHPWNIPVYWLADSSLCCSLGHCMWPSSPSMLAIKTCTRTSCIYGLLQPAHVSLVLWILPSFNRSRHKNKWWYWLCLTEWPFLGGWVPLFCNRSHSIRSFKQSSSRKNCQAWR